MDANVTTRPDPSDTQTTMVEVDGEIAGGFTLVSTRPTAFAAHFAYESGPGRTGSTTPTPTRPSRPSSTSTGNRSTATHVVLHGSANTRT